MQNGGRSGGNQVGKQHKRVESKKSQPSKGTRALVKTGNARVGTKNKEGLRAKKTLT